MYFGKCLRIKYVNFRMRDIELKEILIGDIQLYKRVVKICMGVKGDIRILFFLCFKIKVNILIFFICLLLLILNLNLN